MTPLNNEREQHLLDSSSNSDTNSIKPEDHCCSCCFPSQSVQIEQDALSRHTQFQAPTLAAINQAPISETIIRDPHTPTRVTQETSAPHSPASTVVSASTAPNSPQSLAGSVSSI